METVQSARSDIVDPFGDMISYHLRRTSVAVLNSLAAELQPLALNPSEATLLLWIGANSGATQSDISRALNAKAANLVPLINKLSLVGVLERGPKKGRAIALSLSPAGIALHDRVKQVFDRHERSIGRSIPQAKRRELVDMLNAICRDACRFPQDLAANSVDAEQPRS